MANDPHREACRRQHRIVAQYLAVQAWQRRLDCIVLVRNDLEKFLGLKRFKAARVGWLREDFEPWFPYQSPYYRTVSPSSIHSLFLSRVPIKLHLPSGAMSSEQRINQMEDDAPPTARFSETLSAADVPTEKDIVAELAVLSAGLDAPAIPTKKKLKRRRL